MTVTLKDIADRVGKSVPTVSRALAGYEDISSKTRAHIQSVAREMGYVPNTFARKLQKQQADAIGLILQAENLRFSDPFFSEFLSGVITQTSHGGFDLTITTAEPEKELDTYIQHIRGRRVDGFVLVRTERQDARIELLQEYGIPFVAFGRMEADNDFPFVDEDGEEGIRQIVAHLVGLGHTRLACIAEPLHLTKSYHRVQGFLGGLQAHNLPFEPELLVETRFRQRSGRLAAHQLFELPVPPTAIVACNDLLALGAMHAAQERGLIIGRDVSITGFDDILLAEMASPPLTTLHQPAQEMGALVAQTLLQLINDKPVTQKQTIIKPELVIRTSSGRYPPGP